MRAMGQTEHGLFPALNWGDPVDVDGDFQLPAGTVTLFLADVDPGAEQAAADVLAIAAEIVGRHDGVRPLEPAQDAPVVAAFARASDAVACALAVQEKLVGVASGVRIGIHAAEAQLGPDRSYVGPPVERTARLCDAGHGGQVLLSRTAAELVGDRLPDGAHLQDLGSHRLRDLARPERIFQLHHPAIRSEFPPLRTLDTYRHNLPEFRNPLFGRHDDAEAVRHLLADNRLVTLHGGGGCGKTRLAVHVAAEELDDFPDGVFFADLSGVSSGEDVAATVLAALGIGVDAAALAPYLFGKQLLLVLDNCEHLIDAVAPMLDRLLASSPAFKVLATSREPLGVPGEVTLRVPSLEVPPKSTPAGIEALTPYAAAQLLIDRARRVRPDFDPTSDDAAAIAEICRRLDGVPLAIELAAARVRAMTLAEISSGLDERFRLLTGGARTALPRQQTLRASVAWSHDLLTEPERVAFRRMAIFAGTFTLAAARDVVVGDDVGTHHVLDLVTLLVDKSLVTTAEAGGTTRYRLPETIRQFALEHLATSGEESRVAARHTEHYRQVSDSFLSTMTLVEVDLLRPMRIEVEHDNLRSALRRSLEMGDTETAGTVACGLMAAMSSRGDGSPPLVLDARLRLEEMTPSTRVTYLALATAGGGSGVVRNMPSLDVAADAAWCRMHGQPGRALLLELLTAGPPWRALPSDDELHAALDALDATGDVFAQMMAWMGLGRVVEWGIPEVDTERFWWRIHRTVQDAGGDPRWVDLMAAQGLSLKGFAYRALERSAGPDDLPARRKRCVLLTDRARALLAIGRLDEASESLDQVVALASEVDAWGALGIALHHRGLLAHLAGDAAGAVRLYRAAIQELARDATPTSIPYVVRAYSDIADASLVLGDEAEARAAISAATPFAPQGFHRSFLDRARAAVARHSGDLDGAEQAAHGMLAVSAAFSIVRGVTVALELLGGSARHAESPLEAARLFGAAQALRDEVGDLARYQPYAGWYEEDLEAVRRDLGVEAFAAARDEGQEMSWRDAVSYARRGRGERRRPTSGWGSLTPTEVQVVDLLAEGLSNKEIAARLYVSDRTVGTHLGHVYAKLGFGSRTELTAAAVRRRDRQDQR